MNVKRFDLVLLVAWAISWPAAATVRYVDINSTNPVSPYASWSTAAVVIQDAVDAAAVGDEIVVADGVYATGGRALSDTLTNRVAVDKAVTLRSLNGPANANIRGRQVPGTINGEGAVRCVALADGAVLSGFTLTNGATRNAGDYLTQQFGGGVWCPSRNATVTNCLVSGNSAAAQGGGGFRGTFLNCTLAGNTAPNGGGVSSAAVNNCLLSGNSAVASPPSVGCGGGSCSSTLNNCALLGNLATNGGGTYSSTLNNCTLTGNSALNGGGTYNSYLYNCIVYYNTAPTNANCYSSYIYFSCTSPRPSSEYDRGGNIESDPQMVGACHIGSSSPCRSSGSAAYATGSDIDGQPWADPPSMGCAEVVPGTATGSLAVSFSADYTNLFCGLVDRFKSSIQGRATQISWDFGDGTSATNQPNVSHVWVAPGQYSVVLTAYNDDNPAGVTATQTVRAGLAAHFVSAESPFPEAPFSSWATAALDIQDAIDVAEPGAEIVVSNGVYTAGGRALPGGTTNRITVQKPLLVRSVNGPAATVIMGRQVLVSTNGDAAVRCAYLATNAWLVGFTLSNGATKVTIGAAGERSGGGVHCEPGAGAVVSNCVLAANSCAYAGGGADYATLLDCTLTGNSSRNSDIGGGGGAYCGVLSNCTLVANGALRYGGGALSAALTNCTILQNTAYAGGGIDACTISGCLLVSNSAQSGGAAADSTLIGCVLSTNRANLGGASAGSVLADCTISFNSSTNGGGAYYCTLSNCTVFGNLAKDSGGGAWGGDLANCWVQANSAGYGGGGYNATLCNCIVLGNSAPYGIGGIQGGAMRNCTLVGNFGFGVGNIGSEGLCVVLNSIIVDNWPSNYHSQFSPCVLSNCCTTPAPTNPAWPSGSGNFTNSPLFVCASNGDFRLQVGSPCIDAGNNSYAPRGTDPDGNPRIFGGVVDVGAYEFLGRLPPPFTDWLRRYGLPTDGSADYFDPDHDGMNNWQEWRAGTNPTNAYSLLLIHSVAQNAEGILVRWWSVDNRTYLIERATNLGQPAAFTTLQSNVPGQLGTTTFIDSTATGKGPFFYRVGVQ